MESSVMLSIREGEAPEREYEFHSFNRCIIGRDVDCDIRLVGPGVSRRHCAVLVDPPFICVRDLGSLNGTFVNGENIGRREKDERPGDIGMEGPQVDLRSGDEFRICDTVFEVNIQFAAREPELVEA